MYIWSSSLKPHTCPRTLRGAQLFKILIKLQNNPAFFLHRKKVFEKKRVFFIRERLYKVSVNLRHGLDPPAVWDQCLLQQHCYIDTKIDQKLDTYRINQGEKFIRAIYC